MSRPSLSMEQIVENHLRVLATTLASKTVLNYRYIARPFFTYLHKTFPEVETFSHLCRDPHLLGWSRSMCDRKPPLSSTTRQLYLIRLRRLFLDLADNGHPLSPDLIRREDIPLIKRYLPKPLSLEDDQRLEKQLRRINDLESNALLLIRFTGLRIGECVDLPVDCLQQLSAEQWSLHVPLGKLRKERCVPIDEDTRLILDRILAFRALFRPSCTEKTPGFLLPRRCRNRKTELQVLRSVLTQAARDAGCTTKVTPHRLRHTYATTMLRLGVSLPALMQLLGHSDIHMTMLYLEVTQQDLQREFHNAQKIIASLHSIPQLPLPKTATPQQIDLSAIHNSIAALRHLLQLFRLQQQEPKTRRTLHHLSQRLLKLKHALDQLLEK